jgi:ATP-binding protein involved in chromosome partitioning
MVTKQQVLEKLREVVDPELKLDVVALNMIKDLEVDGDRVSFTLELTSPACPFNEQIEHQVREAARSVSGVREVNMKVTARVRTGRPALDLSSLAQVKNIIGIASGKGGVGKSTVSCNLAAALSALGAKVGLLDADIYGPALPRLLKVVKWPQVVDRKVLPAESFHGLKLMSFGFVVNDETPVIWRGPLISSALRQLLADVQWGELDYLLVDLPPGTGDIPLTLAQSIPLTGVVIVTTPHETSAFISSKSVLMFKRLGVEVLGMIENMSYYVCPCCGSRSMIFGEGAGLKYAEQHGIPLLGTIPLSREVRERSDEGLPIVVSEPGSPAAKAFFEAARRLAGRVSVAAYAKGGAVGGSEEGRPSAGGR